MKIDRSILRLFIYIAIPYLCIHSFDITAQSNVTYGIKAGVTMGALIGDIDQETSSGAPAWGPHFGLFTEIPLSSKWTFRPEIMYNKSGVSYQEMLPRTDTLYLVDAVIDTFFIPTFYTSDVRGEYDMHFVDIPLKMMYQLSPKMNLTIGPRFSYLIKGYNIGTRIIDVGEVAGQPEDFATEAEYLDALFTRSIEDYDDGHTIERFNIGIVFGSQYQFSKRFGIYFDSNIDVTVMQEKSSNVPYNLKHLYLSFGLSYIL